LTDAVADGNLREFTYYFIYKNSTPRPYMILHRPSSIDLFYKMSAPRRGGETFPPDLDSGTICKGVVPVSGADGASVLVSAIVLELKGLLGIIDWFYLWRPSIELVPVCAILLEKFMGYDWLIDWLILFIYLYCLLGHRAAENGAEGGRARGHGDGDRERHGSGEGVARHHPIDSDPDLVPARGKRAE